MQLARPRVGLLLFIFVAAVYLVTAGGHTYSPDEEAMYYVTKGLVREHSLNITIPGSETAANGVTGPIPGAHYSKYGLGQSLFAVPLYLIGEAAANALGGNTFEWLTRFAVSLLDVLATALTSYVVYRTGLTLGYTWRTSIVLALIFSFCTMAWPYSKTFFSEPLCGLALAGSTWMAIASRQSRLIGYPLACGAWLGIGVLTRTSFAICVPCVVIYVLLARFTSPGAHRIRGTLETGVLLSIGLIGALLLTAMYDTARFGNPLATGYGGEATAFVTPLQVGLYGLLLSPGRSIFVFSPPLLLSLVGAVAFWRNWRWEAILVLTLVVSNTVISAAWWSWSGGGVWGPRLLLPVIPVLVLPAGTVLAKARQQTVLQILVALVTTASFAVQIPAIAINSGTYNNSGYAPSEEAIWYEVGFSPVVGQWVRLVNSLKYWEQYRLARNTDVIFDHGFEPSSTLFAGTVLPRWMTGAGEFRVHAVGDVPVVIRVVYDDSRPPGSAKALPRVWSDNSSISQVETGDTSGGRHSIQFKVLRLSSTSPWILLHLQVNPWFQQISGGGHQYTVERGVMVTEVDVDGVALERQKARVTLPQLTDPKALWGWFYDPRNINFDFWWWYWYFADLPRYALYTLIPIATVALVSGFGIFVRLMRPSDVSRANSPTLPSVRASDN